MSLLIRAAYVLILASCLLAASGQLLLKLGAPSDTSWRAFTTAPLIIGLVLYAAGTVLWVLALKNLDLHIAYSFTALTFLLVYAGSYLLLGEQLTTPSLLGAGFILIGFLIITTVRHGH